MMRAVIRFEVIPGAELAFETAFRDAGMFERPRVIEGFVSMELIKSVEDPTEYLVISTWKQQKDYRAWQAVSSSGAPVKR